MTELSHFKKRSLDLLRERGEGPRIYPIAITDLIGGPIAKRCPICQERNVYRISEVDLISDPAIKFFSTAVCPYCLYVFRPISPSYLWFKKCWDIIAEEDPKIFNPAMEKFRESRYGEYVKILNKYVRGNTVLDIGAGYGTGTEVLRRAGFSATAMEPEKNRVRFMRNTYDFRVLDKSIEEWIPGSASWDVVVYAQCLEHADDPVFALLSLRDMLKPNGIAYVEIPLIWGIVDWSDSLFLAHKSNFTRENFSYFVRSIGFDILESAEFRNGPKEPLDFGLILRAADRRDDIKVPDGKRDDIGAICSLYRKGLPEDCRGPLDQVIHYIVPHIEQFYYTMRLDQVKFSVEGEYVRLER